MEFLPIIMSRRSCKIGISRKGICATMALMALISAPCQAEVISWSNGFNATNLDAFGAPMNAGFQFSLGVFAAGFTPSNANISSWEANWHSAQTTHYDPVAKRFNSLFTVTSSLAPFTVGTPGWIFGKRQTNGVREWILFRRDTWTWPAPNPTNPPTISWSTERSNVVAHGSVDTDGVPFLMQPAVVPITYAQWKLAELAGEAEDSPTDDPDDDGVVNLLEFVLNGDPLDETDAPAITATRAGGHLQALIPRRADRQAVLTVEVSSDLEIWHSGPAHTVILEQGPLHLLVRDLTPASAPRRFIRLKATL